MAAETFEYGRPSQTSLLFSLTEPDRMGLK
jgi:hypothetical protein